jgi:Tfp pilus assembly protein PilV
MNRRRRAAGFTLLEALIALLIGGFGLLAVARLQIGMQGESDLAKQLSEATFLGQRRIEMLRAYQQLPAADATALAAGRWGYDNILTGSETIPGGNASYTVRWTITPASGTNPPRFKTAVVNVGWTDRNGKAQTASLSTVISGSDPAAALGLTVPPSGTPIRRPKNRDLNVPVPAIDLGNGTSAFTPPGAPADFHLVFNNLTGVVTKRCTGSGTAWTTWTCVDTRAYLVSGFLTISAWSRTKAPVGSLSLTSPIQLQIVPSVGTFDACYDDSGLSTKTNAGFITYTCVIVGSDHDGNEGTPHRWSGPLNITGITIGSTAGTTKVCRFSGNYDGSVNSSGNPTIENYEHPAVYTNVIESLENQNFHLLEGSQACPAGTVQHQP